MEMYAFENRGSELSPAPIFESHAEQAARDEAASLNLVSGSRRLGLLGHVLV